MAAVGAGEVERRGRLRLRELVDATARQTGVADARSERRGPWAVRVGSWNTARRAFDDRAGDGGDPPLRTRRLTSRTGRGGARGGWLVVEVRARAGGGARVRSRSRGPAEAEPPSALRELGGVARRRGRSRGEGRGVGSTSRARVPALEGSSTSRRCRLAARRRALPLVFDARHGVSPPCRVRCTR